MSDSAEQSARALLDSMRALQDCLASDDSDAWMDALDAQQGRLAALKRLGDAGATLGADSIEALRDLEANIIALAQQKLDSAREEFAEIRGARTRIGPPRQRESVAQFVSHRA